LWASRESIECPPASLLENPIAKIAGFSAEKGFGMLRVPQHERKIINDFKSSSFVLSHVEGFREDFSATR
jgi:hypothetical protein